jgi:glycine dehydrogenase
MAFDSFQNRHIGPRNKEIQEMLNKTGVSSLDELIDKTIPDSIRLKKTLKLDEGISEYEYFSKIRGIAAKNKLYKTYIGLGYYGTILPAVIQRNILENPVWYTSYTPYQAEISQGRLEALLNFQTVVMDLTGMEVANASLLDEATAAAEAMLMSFRLRPRAKVKSGANKFFIDRNVFRQTLEVVEGRAEHAGIEIIRGDFASFEPDENVFGVLVQYPDADGEIADFHEFVEKTHTAGSLVTVAADILSLVLLTPPGEWGADIVVGSTQRFGVPIGFGGPHAGYFATLEKFKRNIPGRIIGLTVDAQGNQALRMALQTREQHIKRERASSNICTAQALLATMAGMYAVYHGQEGLKRIAMHIHSSATRLENGLISLGLKQLNKYYFDTLKLEIPGNINLDAIRNEALKNEINLRYIDDNHIGISLDETTSDEDLNLLLSVFAKVLNENTKSVVKESDEIVFDEKFLRKSSFLTLDTFNNYRSETEMMRYIKSLERKDFSLTHSMISLGSCTMKLNAAVEMFPLSWPEFGNIHPFVPENQTQGYQELIKGLEEDLKIITGFSAVSFQPNSGAAGEYTGLSVIRAWHESRGEGNRNIILIPSSAHGTNPASAVMAGYHVVVVDCDENGNIDLESLRSHAESKKENLAGFMVTYPSTHGVFEEEIVEMISIIHKNGGQVYMDGANMNAQIGFTNPATIGADVCHLNLHKTFAIPHGGGGPGVGPIAVAEHLAAFLPGHPYIKTGGKKGITTVSASPFGSASILPISYGYIKMLGREGLKKSTAMAILNANYLASSLKDFYDILYTGKRGFVGHEMILDCRKFKAETGITELDIAKRLMDYGFHAPTLSFPVHGTLMVEPTESESLRELNKFIEAMIGIYREIMEVKENGSKENNVLKNAPHTDFVVVSDGWNYPYTREKAAYPSGWVREKKLWPAIGRVDDAYGDRNLVCTCAPIDSYRKETFGFSEIDSEN